MVEARPGLRAATGAKTARVAVRHANDLAEYRTRQITFRLHRKEPVFSGTIAMATQTRGLTLN
jgi:hypothetical protein